MTKHFADSTIEDATLQWLQGLGYALLPGPAIVQGGLHVEWERKTG